MNKLLLPLLLFFSLLSSPTRATAQDIRLPAGFEITEYADSSLANNIYCLTINPKGQVIVSGPDYVRLLVEAKDGKAHSALDFTAAPKDGAMGLCWDGDDLLAVGGGGVLRWRQANGPGRTKPPELLFKCKTGGEHDAHAIQRGPDGWFYLLCGNHAQLHASLKGPFAPLPTSPLKSPLAGCVLRFPPDFKGCEILADGLRNAYGMDFNSDGELFTFDSDNERCVSLPWYEFTRLYHLVPGGHYGWLAPERANTWRVPPTAADVVAPLLALGRGSPTGVVCYKHTQFPPPYRGGLFLLDWTFGRIWFVSLKHSGSTYSARAEVFLQALGENGLAPTAAAVHPLTGDLFFSVGGRGTRGAVYRVRYPRGLADIRPSEVAALQPPPRSLDWKAGLADKLLAQAESPDLHARRRALADLHRQREHLSPTQLEKVILANADEPDRQLRQATANLLADLPEELRTRIEKRLTGTHALLTRHLASPGFAVMSVIEDPKAPLPARCEAVRLLQLALGDLTESSSRGTVWEGYTRKQLTPAVPPAVKLALNRVFPSGQADLDRELARTLAMLEDNDPAGPEKLARLWSEKSDPLDDIHYLIVLARLPAPRSALVSQVTAKALLALDRKLTARKLTRDSHWPLRMAELHIDLARRDPALNKALLTQPEFGRPDHALFARTPDFDRKAATERFLQAARQPGFTWNAELIELLGELPAEKSLPTLRALWGEAGLDAVILPLLAHHAQPQDIDRLRSGLTSPRLATVRLCLTALDRLPTPTAQPLLRDETLALIKSLRQVPPGKEEQPLRDALSARLTKLTGQKHSTVDEWLAFCRKTYPERAAELLSIDGVDSSAWEKRLSGVEWDKGDAERGRTVFVKASCASCHSGGQALGPDLAGVAGRFSRQDLFTAIVQPSKEVSPRYRTTLVTTAEGKSYQGLIIYEAVDSLILLTGPGTTVRLANRQITEMKPTAISLMPAGLLDRSSNQDLADLYAYLRSFAAGPRPPR